MVKTQFWQRLYPELADKEWFVNALSAGLSYHQMAKRFGCARETVRKAARYHGIDRRPPCIIIKNDNLKEALDKIK